MIIQPESNASRLTAETLHTTNKAAASGISDNRAIGVKSTVVLSSLAQQLSDSASRAEEYAGLSRKELGAKATDLLSKITGTAYDANRAINNAEVPDSSDPERLARAAQATKFVNGNGSNPFAGLSRDSLALISYDDSGLYTTNERRAAWEEAFDQESAWRKEFAAKAMAEYNSTGKLTDSFSTALVHFKTLPAIEQAQYPGDYEAKLQSWIDLDYNYLTNTVEGKGNPGDALSLEESLNML
ncbi:hypothetical protein EDF81_0718 [Enterobacter sp. BIGb0383]|uniref:hypothetical protein n=1 Tax=unclassified Enterobacter TaxID=2608935 RepID=UPI000FC09EFD|nr:MULTISPECIES: hypothetical protein [unclassified Enterobacter]ROP62235.1 hypothetical protein EDF81_0718 [Enterobacter sp. BIGb0383]ROS12396.1 hypothetical protein EC848_0720 [Enterobacter sp. BIGb0359]